MVLPALALTEEVGEAISQARGDDRVARREAPARDGGGERERRAGGDRDPDVPPIERPALRPPQARVERHQVAYDDLVPRREPARRGEPDDDGKRRHGERRREDRDRRGDGPPPTARDEGDEHEQGGGEEPGVRLDRDAGAERQPAPREARPLAWALGPARDAECRQQQERTQEKIALPCLPGAGGQMVRGEEEAGAGRRETAPGCGQRRGRERRRGEPCEIERAPTGVA